MAVARTEKKRRSVRKPRAPGAVSSSKPVISNRRTTGRTEALPGWSDLAKSNQRASATGRGATFLERISTTRFAVLIVALAILFTTYVGHVHATQNLLANVQQLRRENLELHLKYNRLKGDFDRMVGPGVIYERAGRLGLVEDATYGPTIEVNP
jgi:hypothetical protein